MSTISAIGERRRALELLSRSPTGCTETLMLAHGFSEEVLGRLVVDGFAGLQRGMILAGERQLLVNWMEITDLGHAAITDAVSGHQLGNRYSFRRPSSRPRNSLPRLPSYFVSEPRSQ